MPRCCSPHWTPTANPDGGYGWGLEPDLRSRESQPAAAAHAFEVFEEIAPATAPQAVALCDWLGSITLPDGGLPFALPLGSAAGCAPLWTGADPSESSLQITAFTAAAAQRAARHDPAVAGHPWLEHATEYCLRPIDALEQPPFAYVVAFSIRFLDAVADSRPEVALPLEKLASPVPADGRLRVSGGTEDEALRPLDVALYPDRPARELFSEDVIAADLDRFAAGQQDDGGWTVDFNSASTAGAFEWRGYATVRTMPVLSASAR